MYLKQRDNYSCAPIAVMNALLWAGHKITYASHFKSVSAACNTDVEGTYSADFERALHLYGQNLFTVRKRVNIDVDELVFHVENGGAFVMSCLEAKGMIPQWLWDRGSQELEWHISFWHSFENGVFKCAQGRVELSPSQMQSLIEDSNIDGYLYPEIWLLRKKK